MLNSMRGDKLPVRSGVTAFDFAYRLLTFRVGRAP
jgi:hypothetical protein